MDMRIGSKPALMTSALALPALLGACVARSDYDAIKTQNDQLQQQLSAQAGEIASDKAQIARLQGAIKYTVNSDLLFPSGGWQMSASGKRIIAQLAKHLAPSQQNRLLVKGYTDNAPIGPALQAQGITSNQVLSQRRADDVMQYLISQGVQPGLVAAKGFGDAEPLASNETPQGRTRNRRVEITLASMGS
jgi:chemotaxis protein MotB